jgi:hypothetical protein
MYACKSILERILEILCTGDLSSGGVGLLVGRLPGCGVMTNTASTRQSGADQVNLPALQGGRFDRPLHFFVGNLGSKSFTAGVFIIAPKLHPT